MIRIDSITLAISHDKVEINHLDMFKASQNGLILNPNIIGFNQIQLLTNIVRLHISSKILLEQYVDGINKNTIQRVFDVIDSSQFVKLKTRCLSDYKVHKCDFVANFKTEKEHMLYYQVLNLISNSHYKNVIYDEKKASGFTFIGKQDKNKYLNFYDKEKELLQPVNKPLVNAVGIDRLRESFKNVIRIEFKAITFKQIKDFCGIKDIGLNHVLDGKGNPLHKIFYEIVGNAQIPENCLLLLEGIKSSKELNDFLLNLAYKVWLYQHNGDIGQALIPIKNKLKACEKDKQSVYNKFKIHKLKLQAIKSSPLNINPNEYIDEIKNFLLNQVIF